MQPLAAGASLRDAGERHGRRDLHRRDDGRVIRLRLV